MTQPHGQEDSHPSSDPVPGSEERTIPSAKTEAGNSVSVIRRHLIFGWALLLISTIIGVSLETMHGFKLGWYLDVGNETRRLMLTLGHAHGALLALVNIVFGVALTHLSDWSARGQDFASRCLMIGSILVPGGFLLGGLHIYDGDPGLGIMLVPVGALAFIAMLFSTLVAACRQST